MTHRVPPWELQKPPYIRANLGLGDAIALNGAVMATAQDYGTVTFPSAPHNLATVKSLYIDHPEVTVVDVVQYTQQCSDERPYEPPDPGAQLVLGLEYDKPRINPYDQYRRLYKRFHIPYEWRWSLSTIPEAVKSVKQAEQHDTDDYVFMHDFPLRNMTIDRKYVKGNILCPVHRSDVSILAYANVIENAREVHVIDSCFFHLTEHLQPKGQLFFHRYAREYWPQLHHYKTKLEWTILT